MVELKNYGIIGAELIYYNPFREEKDIRDFIMEGSAKISFPKGRLRMENALAAENGQKANYVLWCPEEFPADVYLEWEFKPLNEPGLCILFFAAKGKNGEDLFDPSLAERTGEYPQYHHGDINAFHVSYFRRKEPDERAFHTCNLRKSYGFYLTAQGGDPIPDADECREPYRMAVLKKGPDVRFFINELEIFHYIDDGRTYGPALTGGRAGFRQLAPLTAEYGEFKVYAV